MNILLIGSGGREHALAWKLAQSPECESLWASPGNPGMAQCATCVALDAGNHAAISQFCGENSVDLVVIGPEAPLVDGLADSLREAGIATFGPSAKAAQLEGSKGFTKDMCARANIPTGGYIRTTSLDAAISALDDYSAPYVLKADGLAAGKGVVIAESRADAEAALNDMFGGQFGDAGAEVVIEEFLPGEEASFFAITDGASVIPFGTAQDHKRVGEGDTGPNTGGMGAYSPAPVLTPELQKRTMEEIIMPTVNQMAADGMPYSGVLYAGLMLTPTGPQLIEYNCRFGDPECQVLMTRLQSDLATIGTPEKGGAIDLGDAESEGAKVFHAGTSMDGDQLVASGGRVLNVTASGANVTEAQAAAYEAVDAISFPSGFCRRDIGWREIAREVAREAES